MVVKHLLKIWRISHKTSKPGGVASWNFANHHLFWNLRGQKRLKFGAILDNFWLWLQIFLKHSKLSKIVTAS